MPGGELSFLFVEVSGTHSECSLSHDIVMPGVYTYVHVPYCLILHCSSTETKFIVCELCNIQVTSPFELQQHLGSSSHRGNEERLFSDDLELDKALEERESKKLTT